jgi:hypothetical protein
MGVLNLWECGEPGCKSTAVGDGAVLGLRAIGWWFEVGGRPLCPAHRPDRTTKRSLSHPCDQTGPCSWCRGDEEADKLQYLIAQYLELTGEDLAYYRKRAEQWEGSCTES